jgi:hypothetical protein
MLETLREDFTRLPALLALGAPEQPPVQAVPELAEPPEPAEAPGAPESPERARESPSAAPKQGSELDQLGLF